MQSVFMKIFDYEDYDSGEEVVVIKWGQISIKITKFSNNLIVRLLLRKPRDLEACWR